MQDTQQTQQITWTLPLADAQLILNVLNDLPTKSGVFPLVQHLVGQANEQLKPVAE